MPHVPSRQFAQHPLGISRAFGGRQGATATAPGERSGNGQRPIGARQRLLQVRMGIDRGASGVQHPGRTLPSAHLPTPRPPLRRAGASARACFASGAGQRHLQHPAGSALERWQPWAFGPAGPQQLWGRAARCRCSNQAGSWAPPGSPGGGHVRHQRQRRQAAIGQNLAPAANALRPSSSYAARRRCPAAGCGARGSAAPPRSGGGRCCSRRRPTATCLPTRR